MQTPSSCEIDAIARGVQQRYIQYLGLSTPLCNEVVAVARKLHLPEALVNQWLKEQAEHQFSLTEGTSGSPQATKRKPRRANVR